jgi:uncharacterized protein YecT (DUF1311 family)
MSTAEIKMGNTSHATRSFLHLGYSGLVFVGNLFVVLLIVMAPAYAAKDEDSCSSVKKPPKNFICHAEVLRDCRLPQGRPGSVLCVEQRQNILEFELNSRYQKVLKSYEKDRAESGANIKEVHALLIASQLAWRRYANADCLLSESLAGNGWVDENCMIDHIRQRLLVLKRR